MSSATRLYRQLARCCRRFEDYNVRSYSLRRCRVGFEESRGVNDPAVLESLLEAGRGQLKLLQRQALINNMYSDERSVMEVMGPVSNSK